jgi:hypothetical protein
MCSTSMSVCLSVSLQNVWCNMFNYKLYAHRCRPCYGTVLLYILHYIIYILLYIQLEGGLYELKRVVNYLKWKLIKVVFVCFCPSSPQWAMASSSTMFVDHTWRHTTVGRTSLDKWSAHSRALYLTTLTTGNRPCPGGIPNSNRDSESSLFWQAHRLYWK